MFILNMFNITPIVFVWKKKAIYTQDGLRVSKSWGNFNFCVNYLFNSFPAIDGISHNLRDNAT